MSRVVLDASVLIAVIRDETLDDAAAPAVEGAYISTVNFAEVLTHLAEHSTATWERLPLLSLLRSVVPFTTSQAHLAASLRASTRSAGLSLGDRACLALAMELDADVYTADRVWSTLDLPCRVHLVR